MRGYATRSGVQRFRLGGVKKLQGFRAVRSNMKGTKEYPGPKARVWKQWCSDWLHRHMSRAGFDKPENHVHPRHKRKP